MDFDFEKEFVRIWNSTGADPRYPAKQYMQPYLDAGYGADPVSDLRRSSIDWSKYSQPEPKPAANFFDKFDEPMQSDQASSVDWNSYKKDDYWANVEKAGAGNDYWANVEKKGQQKNGGSVDWNSYKQPEALNFDKEFDNAWKQTGPKSFDLGATFNDFASGATDAAAGALAGAEHVGRNLERFLSPVNQGRAVAGGLDWVFGGRSFGDAYDSMFGGVMNRPTFEQQYEKYGYEPNKEGMFAPFNVGKIAGEAATLPALGGAGTLGRSMLLGAGEGMLGAGILEGGDQLAEGKFDLPKLAGTLAMSAPFGAAGGAIGHGITQGISKMAGKMGIGKAGDVGAGGKPYVSADELAARDLINEEEAALLRAYGIDTSAKHIVDEAGNTVQRPTIQHMPRDPFELDQVSSIKSVPGGGRVEGAGAAAVNPRVADADSFFDLRAQHPDVPMEAPAVPTIPRKKNLFDFAGDDLKADGDPLNLAPAKPETQGADDFLQQFKAGALKEADSKIITEETNLFPRATGSFWRDENGKGLYNALTDDELEKLITETNDLIAAHKAGRLTNRRLTHGTNTDLEGFVQEKMRRERRKVRGIEPDWNIGKGAKQYRHMTMEELQSELQHAASEREVEAIVKAMDDKVAPVADDLAKPVPVLEQPAPELGVTMGDYRSPLSLDAAGNTIHGQKRGGLGVNIDDPAIDALLPAGVRELMRTYAGQKAAVEQAMVDAEEMAAKIWEQFGHLAQPKSKNNSTPVIKLGNLDIEGPGTVKRPHKAGNDALAALKHNESDMVVPGLDATARATLDDVYKKSMRPSQFELSPNLEDNYPALRQVYDTIKEWKAKGGNSERLRKELTDALHGIQSDNPALEIKGSVDLGGGKKVNVEYRRGQIQRGFAAEEIPKIAKKIAKEAGEALGLDPDEIQGMAASEEMRLWQDQAKKAGESPDNWVKVKQQAAERFRGFLNSRTELKKELADLGKLDYEKPVKGSIKGTRRKSGAEVRKIAGAMLGLSGAAYATSNQAAEAYTTGGEPGRRADQVKDGIIGTAQKDAIPAALMTAAVGAALATPAGRKVLKGFIDKGFDISGRILGDTMDHVAIADAKLGTNMLGELERHNIGAIQAMMRVDFGSDTLKSQAMRELSEAAKAGLTTPQQTADSAFHKLSPEAQNALLVYNAQKKTLAKKVREFNARVKESGEDLGFLTKQHLSSLENGLTGKTDNDWMSQFTGQAMDFFFRVNPEFHLLNLTDPYIAGSARVAPSKIMKAQAMLTTNSKIKDLFKNNNLVGSFKADILDDTAGSKIASRLKDFDLPSDKINASSLALGSMLQQMEVQGVKATPETFVEAMLTNRPTGQITQDVIDKAWVQVADDAMRVLAVDPLRMNKNALGVMPGARHFAAFINQPARISKLTAEMVKNKDYKKMGRFLMMTTAIGGRAAIPKSVRTAWELHDPDTAFAAESLLDDYSIAGLTGNVAREQVFKDNPEAKALVSSLMPDMANKVEYGILPGESLTMGALSPGFESWQKDIFGGKLASDYENFRRTGNPMDLRKATVNTLDVAAKTGIAGQVPGLNVLPLGAIKRAAKAGIEMYDGERNVYAFDGDKYMGKKTVNYDKLFPGAWFVVPAADAVLPGDNQIVSGLQLSMKEKAKRKRAGRATKSTGKRQAYVDPLSDLVSRW